MSKPPNPDLSIKVGGVTKLLPLPPDLDWNMEVGGTPMALGS